MVDAQKKCQLPFLPKVLTLIWSRWKCPKVNSSCINFTHKTIPFSKFLAFVNGTTKPPETLFRNMGCPGPYFLSQVPPWKKCNQSPGSYTAHLPVVSQSQHPPPATLFVRFLSLLTWTFPIIGLPVPSLEGQPGQPPPCSGNGKLDYASTIIVILQCNYCQNKIPLS